jgi:3-phosphoshikimate 1-carboxyvinyltransferase
MNELMRVEGARQMRGSLHVPGDKSGSHRALMLSALAPGESSISGLSPGQDVASTSRIVCQLGAERFDDEDTVLIRGPASGLRMSEFPLDCGNSGTTMRLMAGIVSTIEGEHLLVGDESLSRRPMDRVAQPLTLMGAAVHGSGARGHAPLHVTGRKDLHSIDYHVPTPSAQVKSAVLLAGLSAQGETRIEEDVRTRTTTEDMLRRAGIELTSSDVGDGRHIVLRPGRPMPQQWRIPGDPSQAAFFAVLGLVHADAFIEVLEVDGAPERVGFVAVLQRMGGRIELRSSGPSTSIVSQSSALVATEIYAHEIPSVDEVPVLAVAAAAATGVSAFRHMSELRLKESDRFAGAMDLASALGCRVWSEGDDFFVEGLCEAGRFSDLRLDAGLDHRMVMASAVAGAAGSGCSITGVETVASSYPDFFQDLDALR